MAAIVSRLIVCVTEGITTGAGVVVSGSFLAPVLITTSIAVPILTESLTEYPLIEIILPASTLSSFFSVTFPNLREYLARSSSASAFVFPTISGIIGLPRLTTRPILAVEGVSSPILGPFCVITLPSFISSS